MKSMCVEHRYIDETIFPIYNEFCESPDLDREIILGGQVVEGVETVTSFVYGEPAAYEALLTEDESVDEYTITPAEDGFFLYLRRALGPEGLSMMNAIAQDTVVIVPPIEFRSDRTMKMTIVGHSADLRAVLDRMPGGIELDVQRVSDGLAAYGAPLSDRQREALGIAWDVGYYEIPRRNGIEAVANQLSCAVSTASELLRRGEAQAVSQVVGTQL